MYTKCRNQYFRAQELVGPSKTACMVCTILLQANWESDTSAGPTDQQSQKYAASGAASPPKKCAIEHSKQMRIGGDTVKTIYVPVTYMYASAFFYKPTEGVVQVPVQKSQE